MLACTLHPITLENKQPLRAGNGPRGRAELHKQRDLCGTAPRASCQVTRVYAQGWARSAALTQAMQPQHVRGNPSFSGPRDKQNPAGLPEPRAEASLPTSGMCQEAGPPEGLHRRAVTFQIMLNFLGVWSSPSTTAQVRPMPPSLFSQPPPPNSWSSTHSQLSPSVGFLLADVLSPFQR